MQCHICHREAVDRCYTCGELFCEAHGGVHCSRCETGVMAGDNRADRVSPARQARKSRPAWWRPQVAEDYEPPACQDCRGIAPYVCPNCGARYCGEHAGKNGLCSQCQQALCGGNVFLAIMILILGGLTLFGYLQL